tara:strand:+ start:19503 stop:20501 length:999 start_codon:yes stop_codon:yes gene_type:complete
MFDGKKVFVTGATGSFGQKFIGNILTKYNPEKVIVFSRDELKQHHMQTKFSDHSKVMRYFIGDVRDLDRLRMSMRDGVDVLIHAAALKQVPAMEYNPFEAVKTNILGAQNIVTASLENNVKRIIALSTDKAAAPINLYGATKLASDKIFVAANNYSGNRDIKFSVVRYGNVMGSRGSVIPFFLSLNSGEPFPVTDKRMTRFNITLQNGVDFVIKCLGLMWGGEIFVPKIPSYRITDVVTAISDKAETQEIGIRPGEKLHEEMITQSDALNTAEFEDYYAIIPSIKKWTLEDYLKESSPKIGKLCEDGFSYNSKDNGEFLSVKQLKDLIKEFL